ASGGGGHGAAAERDVAGGPVADLEGASSDRRGATIGIRSGQREGGGRFVHRDRGRDSGNDASKGHAGGAGVIQVTGQRPGARECASGEGQTCRGGEVI